VAPEAAAGGPIGLVEEGDQIAVDLFEKRIDLLVDEETMAGRRAAWKPKERENTGILKRYAATVGGADIGAVQR